MSFVRHRQAVALVNRIVRCPLLTQTVRPKLINIVAPAQNVLYRDLATSTNNFREQKHFANEGMMDTALTALQAAERSRMKIMLMSNEQKEVYFDKLWDSMQTGRRISLPK